MTAPFAAELCGYRPNGKPSTSDSHDPGSVEWGHALFEALGVASGTAETPQVGDVMERRAAEHLASLRPDLALAQSRAALAFEQYRHLDVFRQFSKTYRGPAAELDQALDELPPGPEFDSVRAHIYRAIAAAQQDHQLVTQLQDTMPEESLLRIDITVAAPAPVDRLLIGLSSKWSLRTDRAQDCVSQGAKLVNHRRGHMPHYAVLTMEPRPSMLKLIAYGSGAVDCIYHLALPELRQAAEHIASTKKTKAGAPGWPQKLMLDRMITQGRIRSYQQLVDEVLRLPHWG
ncbi:NgoMIV family type II restriction endonuclease [Rhodococcus sp. PSBB049]|uniref:NgoMIV family type II restriction endonuclease n=1 Tax=Rhodococcus sp. PSBB049 TaxID=2812863 RepID=UPI001F11A16E|nr:NgoMIV family type II restriction endonuclease [Rhodococcus sp. PSBB049]